MKSLIFNFQFSNLNQGISLYLALAIMGILLALALGINTILLGQLGTIREIGNSVIAFYAADTGIEKVLMESNPKNLDGFTATISNEASYELTVESGGEGDCDPQKYYCIKSVGTYKGVKRAIEITY